MPRLKIARYRKLEGQKFGHLTVLRLSNRYELKRGAFWDCVCDCGTERTVRADGLLNGHTKSCGCQRKKSLLRSNTRHGMANQPVYKVWSSMLQRTTNPSCKEYRLYGARGIIADPRWLDFQVFYTDMGEPNGLTLERRDNNKGYSKENCYWADRFQQNQNTRRNRFMTMGDETLCVAEWARRAIVGLSTFQARIFAGWSLEDALYLPRNSRHGNSRTETALAK